MRDDGLVGPPAVVVDMRSYDGDRAQVGVHLFVRFPQRGWDELSQVLGRRLEKVLCPRNVIRRMLKASYGVGADTVARMLARSGGWRSSRSAVSTT